MIHKRCNKDMYAYLTARFNRRLSWWKAKYLSLAGRITLTKLVLNALPFYQMQVMELPRSIL